MNRLTDKEISNIPIIKICKKLYKTYYKQLRYESEGDISDYLSDYWSKLLRPTIMKELGISENSDPIFERIYEIVQGNLIYGN